MSILSGYKRFKKYLRTADGYRLCSEWTKSDSVEMADGKTLQETVSDIGAAVENAQDEIKNVQDDLHVSLGGMTFGVDAAGRYGYIKAGADTVTPFKKNDWGTLSSENIKEYTWTSSDSTYGKNPSLTFRSPSAGQIATFLGVKDPVAGAAAKIIGIKKITSSRPGFGGISSVSIDPNTGSGGTAVITLQSDGDLTTVGMSASINATILVYIPS